MTDSEQEIWKEIKGYEGKYQISNLGRVKSILFNNNKISFSREKILSYRINKFNRCQVMLYKDGKRRNVSIHRLVAEAFIPNPLNKKEVNHIDGDSTNNNVQNLEWVTPSENMKHAYENNLNNLKNINNSKKKPIIRSDGKVFSNAYNAAKELNVSVCSIRDVLKNRIHTCKGYKFKYLVNKGDD